MWRSGWRRSERRLLTQESENGGEAQEPTRAMHGPDFAIAKYASDWYAGGDVCHARVVVSLVEECAVAAKAGKEEDARRWWRRRAPRHHRRQPLALVPRHERFDVIYRRIAIAHVQPHTLPWPQNVCHNEPLLLDATPDDVGAFDAAITPDQTPDAE